MKSSVRKSFRARNYSKNFYCGLLALFFTAAAMPLFSEEQDVVAIEESPGKGLIAQNYSAEVLRLKELIGKKFAEASVLARDGANETAYATLLCEIRSLKKAKESLDEQWRQAFSEDSASGMESYALWDVGEITLSQLIMEYGASEYLYIIPQELSAMKLSIFSNIPVPRENWSEMIEMILAHNGVGARKLNGLVKQLYILKLDPSAIEGIVSREEDLALFDPHSRIFYVFSPQAEQVKSVQAFFERFSDPKQTTIQSISSKVVLVSTRETIEKLMGLYRAVWEKDRGKVVRLINLVKITPQEGERVLKAVFSDSGSLPKPRPHFFSGSGEDLSILMLPQGLVLIGDEEPVSRGERILADLESQLEDPGEKVVYWYSCKHSNPEDIASVLEQVYDSLIGATLEKKHDVAHAPPPPVPPLNEVNPAQVFPYPPSSTAFNPVLPVNPAFVQPGVIESKAKSNYGNFIVDAKTASILMVVRREELTKIKNLLKKLDVPKRMVQIDVLLVEKRMTDRKQVGINLLNFGSTAKAPHETGLIYNAEEHGRDKGLLKFIFQRPPGKMPGFDLTYSFLLAQDDLRINANPSVLAINQTPATISIVEEISINNGAIQLDTVTGVTIEKSFTRAQYGTTIVMVPTIHLQATDDEDPDHPGFVSLQTDVTFDTTEISFDDRPPVTRRHVVNEVQIADGETIILGGLRRKSEEDKREKIPFLGDLPGIGKLFGTTKSHDTSTEMFIFITPHIIRDPVDDLRRLRYEEYKKRAGDLPEFLERLDEAKTKERKRLFDNSLKMLFDKT